ncbi:MAG: ABC transporter permease subunit [Microbacteriaceae bacterium]|nr:ABC transporter permease subunit [Microbacteriaceae bacterium]
MTGTLPLDTVAAAPATTTHLPRLALTEQTEEPQRVRVGASLDDRLSIAGATVGGIGMGILLAGALGVIGWGWMPIVSYAWFVGIYASLTFLGHSGPAVVDRFWSVLLRSAAVVVVASLGIVVVYTLLRGWPVLKDVFAFAPHKNPLHFWLTDMSGVGPLSGLDTGGILYAVIGTLEQIGIALVITVPLGVTSAIFLAIVGGRYARVVRTLVEAMTALPSVVAGLFIYAVIILSFTHQDNGFAAALAISVLMLPIMIRSADVALRLVPGNLREAGLALGASQWSTVWRVILPTMRSGLTTAIILATAHGIGETAPVLLTSGVTSVTNFDPFHNAQTSLPLAALEFIESGRNTLIARGYATAATLLAVVLILFVLARLIGGQEAGKVSAGRLRRLARTSRATLRRVRASGHARNLAAAAGRDPDAPLDPLSAFDQLITEDDA